MKCKQCLIKNIEVDMIIGECIKTDPVCERNICHFQDIINSENLELIQCWKCPNCGHSEEL